MTENDVRIFHYLTDALICASVGLNVWNSRTMKALSNYANITVKYLELYESLCEERQKKKGVVVHPILSKELSAVVDTWISLTCSPWHSHT